MAMTQGMNLTFWGTNNNSFVVFPCFQEATQQAYLVPNARRIYEGRLFVYEGRHVEVGKFYFIDELYRLALSFPV